jgi:uncharacterized membrane protein HdeD (DUF308 family)
MASLTFPRINRLTWLGLALMVLGILAIAAPLVAGKAVVIVVGLILLAAGVGLLRESFDAHGYERLMLVVLGAITALCAIFVLAHPLLGLGFLTFALLVFFIADGLWKIVEAVRYVSSPGWLWLLASGVLSLILALVIWRQWPVSGLWAVGVLIGVNLIGTGAALVALAGSLRDIGRDVLSRRS